MRKVKTDFRLNVVVAYQQNVNVNNFRNPIHSLFKSFAWLHKLDYVIVDDTQFFGDIESELYLTHDLVYLRSTEMTLIDRKALQNLLQSVFSYSYTMTMGVEIYCLMQKTLSELPFPNAFVRPLNYPYLEFHKDGQSEIKLPVSDLKALFPDLDIE